MRESNYNFPRRQSRPIVYGGGGGGGTTSSSGCACSCIDNGDIEVNGIITSSRWSVTVPKVTVDQTYGSITLPAGTYVIEYDTGSNTWILDVGDQLSAAYNNGDDATEDATLDGTITMSWGSSAATISVCIDGTVPEPPEE